MCLDFSQLPENIKEYISRLQNDVQSLQTQLTNLTAVVDFADSTKMAEIEDLKQRHQQELATIQILMEGQTIALFVANSNEFSLFLQKPFAIGWAMLERDMTMN